MTPRERAIVVAAAETVPNPAPAEIRVQDCLNYPHDEHCPNYGRRQWTDENAQTTCQACGTEFPENG